MLDQLTTTPSTALQVAVATVAIYLAFALLLRLLGQRTVATLSAVDLACVMAYYPRAVAHGPLLLEASGLAGRGVTAQMLVELTRVFNLLTYVWYRARRVSRSVPATDLQLESTALRRALLLAPEVEPRHT